ncbi:MAG: hypothetical protein JKY55_13565 [Aliivibrio sp.]|nr:hypothetical protein [Aliivibrio sp.]
MWTQLSLTWPNSAQTIQNQSESVTTRVASEMNSAIGKLQALQASANYSRGALSGDAAALLGLRASLQSLLSTGTVITVSPYTFDVGTTLESGRYLNPQTAVATLAGKLRDHSDKHRPNGNLNVIALMVSASQLGTFAAQLADLVSVFTLPDWGQVARQANALTTNEIDKFHQPAAIVQPRFKPGAQLNANPLGDYLAAQGSEIATLESLADDATNVIDKLQGLAAKRSTTLSEIQSKINALKNLKGNVWSMALSGSNESIATQLSQAQAPTPNNHQHTLASLMISDKPMPFFEQLLC